jgi:hypothetical protein
MRHSVECDILLTKAANAVASPAGVSVETDSSWNVESEGIQASIEQDLLVSVGQHWQQAPTLNVPDLELLHNFCTSTCYTLHSNPTLKTLWRVNAPQLGFSHDFVMRGILSISALHLAHTRPDQRQNYISQALQHNQAGLKAMTAILPSINKKNCSAVYLYSVTTFILTLASPRKPGDLLIMGQSALAEWLTMFRGMQAIVNSFHDELQSGVLGPMFSVGSRRSQLRDEHANKFGSPEEDHRLGQLEFVIRQSVSDPQLLAIYMAAITELQKSFAVAYSGEFQALESSDVFIFLFCVSEEYLHLLKDRTQESLVIFAYFCIITKRLDNHWWSEGWSDHLMSQIHALLDEEHRLWIRWPMEEIGWLPPQSA